jgi:thioredoxin 1
MVITLTKDNYEGEVMKSELPVLVDYWASWCGPCRMVSPIIDSLAEEYEGKIKVGKVNVDDEGELASAAAVVSIPTIILMKDGKTVERMVGARTKDEFEEIIEKYL